MRVTSIKARLMALALWAPLSLSWPQAGAHAQPVTIPLQYFQSQNSWSLGVNVGINGGAPQLYLFDTGSDLFNASFNPATWGGFGPNVPNSTIAGGQGLTTCYGSGTCLTGNLVQVPTLNFYAPGATAGSAAAASLTAAPGFQVNAVYGLSGGPTPPAPNGIFGAGSFARLTSSGAVVGGVLGQTIIPGVSQGYVVSANGQPNPGSYNANGQAIGPIKNGPAGTQAVTIGGQTQQIGSCVACVTVGLTPQIIGQFAPVGPPGQTAGQPGVVPWISPGGPAFPNPYGGATGNNSSTEFGANFMITLGSRTVVGPALLDSGTPFFLLDGNTLFGGSPPPAGTEIAITGAAQGPPIAGLPTSTSTLTGNLPNYSSAYVAEFYSGFSIIGIPFFMQNSVMFDLSDRVIGYTPFYVTAANLATTANGPLIIGASNVPLGLAGVISGAGSVVIQSGGAAQLSATNTYTGLTTIAAASGGNAAGQLLISGPGSIAGSAGVVNNGVFDISRAWLPVSIQTLAGSGQVNLGGQSLILTNANGTFAGTMADGGAFPGRGGSLTLAGGALTFAGTGTYTGGTIVSAGSFTLTGSLNGGVSVLQNGGFAIGAGGTLRGDLANGGMVANAGTLSGNVLNVGSFANSGTVNGIFANVGTLSGTGTMTGNVVNAGTIVPGNPTGTLTIFGNYAQTAGSRYQLQIDGTGQSGQLGVAGAATLQGGTVSVYAPPTTSLPARNTYRLLGARDGVTGAFASVDDPYPFLQSSLSYTANNVFLNLEVGGFSAAAQTQTQYAVGSALDANVNNATGDFAQVLSAMATGTLSSTQAEATLTALSGNNYAGLSSSMVQGALLFMNNFANQTGGGGSPVSNRVALAEACDVACDSTSPPLWGAWGGGLGGLGTIGANAGTGAVTYNVGGFAAGLDRLVAPNIRVGVTAGYATGTQWVGGFDGKSTSDTFQAGLYGGYSQGKVYADAVVGYAYSYNQMWRNIAIPGLAQRTAQGRTGANQFYGQLETGYRFYLGTAADAYVTPFARLQGYTGTQNAFTESGAQSLNLSVAAQTTNSLRSVIGAQLGGALDLGWREKLALQFRLGWSHEYAGTARPVTASFAGAPAAPFTTFGIAPQRDGVVLGLSANTAIAQATNLYLRYEGDISGQDSAHALTAGVRMTW